MGQIDIASKDMMENNRYFADAANYFLNDGERVFRPEQLNEMNGNQIVVLQQDGGETIPAGNQRFRDVVKSVCINGKYSEILCITGFENQSSVNRAMPVRDMLYDSLSYTQQIKDMADPKSVLLSSMPEDRYLIPVITIVINMSSKPWDQPLNLYELIDPERREYLRFIPDYKINLIDPHIMTEEDFDKFETNLGDVLRLVKLSEDKRELTKVIKKHKEKYSNIDEVAKNFLEVFTKRPLIKNNEGGYDMYQAFDEINRDVEFADAFKRAFVEEGKDVYSAFDEINRDVEFADAFKRAFVEEGKDVYSAFDEINRDVEFADAFKKAFVEEGKDMYQALEELKQVSQEEREKGINDATLSLLRNYINNKKVSPETAMADLGVIDAEKEKYLKILKETN